MSFHVTYTSADICYRLLPAETVSAKQLDLRHHWMSWSQIGCLAQLL